VPTITKRCDRYQVRVRRRCHAAQSATFRTKAAAERWARSIESGVDEGRHMPDAEARRLTLGDALARYARDVTPKKRGSARELQRIAVWRQHHLAARPLVELRAADLAAKLAAKKGPPSEPGGQQHGPTTAGARP